MINIMINGVWLDVPEQEASVHFANMRFSDVFADPFSTDIELPLTEKNIQALDVWGIHDRSGQLFGSGVACFLVSGAIMGDARLQVSSVSDTAITATLYTKTLPTGLSETFNRLAVDDDGTIVSLFNPTLEASGNVGAEVNFTQYDYGVDLGSAERAIYYPNITLSALLTRIGTAAGVSITPPSTDFRLLATRMRLCPQNKHCNFLFTRSTTSTGAEAALRTHGQHIALGVNGDYIAFNRHAYVAIGATVYVDSYRTDTLVALQYSNDNGATWTTRTYITISSSSSVTFDTYLWVNDGTMVRIYVAPTTEGVFSSSVEAFLACTLSDYDIEEDDYEIEQEYVAKDVPAWVDPSLSYNYYGVICNLPGCTVRELLSAVAWKTGTKISIVGTDISFVDADDTETIEAVIDRTNFTSSFFGQRNIFESADGTTLLSFNIENTTLEEEKVLNTTLFAYINDTTNSVGTMARVPQYSWKMDSSGESAELEYSEIDDLVLVLCIDYTLMAYKTVNTLGLRTIERVIEIEGRTTYDIRQMDYIYILGHKYMLEEGDIDEQTGITTFKALLV